MIPWSSEKRRYFPLLHMMGADLRGFSQLPTGDGAYLTPIIPLTRVGTAHKFDNTLAMVRNGINGVGNCFIADIADSMELGHSEGGSLPVHDVFRSLTGRANSFQAWRQFIRENPDMVPVLRVGNASEVIAQAEDFAALGRGMVLRIRPSRQQHIEEYVVPLLQFLSRNNILNHLLIVIDLEHVVEATLPAATAVAYARWLIAAAGNRRINIAISATSFPLELEGDANQIVRYPITERLIQQEVERSLGPGAVNLFYSDYGSARKRMDERKGGGQAYPRIDYASRARWSSNRQRNGLAGRDGFIEAAEIIMSDEDWVRGLNIYGANMIREAAEGHLDDRLYAKFWVSVRVNLHLHRQAHYHSTESEFLGHESDWED